MRPIREVLDLLVELRDPILQLRRSSDLIGDPAGIPLGLMGDQQLAGLFNL